MDVKDGQDGGLLKWRPIMSRLSLNPKVIPIVLQPYRCYHKASLTFHAKVSGHSGGGDRAGLSWEGLFGFDQCCHFKEQENRRVTVPSTDSCPWFTLWLPHLF